MNVSKLFMLTLPLVPLLFKLVNGVWVPDNVINPASTAPLNAVSCTILINAPWFGTILFYAIYASVLIFLAATEGKFIRFSYASFGMIFLAMPFIYYGCTDPLISFMSSANILVPIAGFGLTLIASIFWG